MQPTTLFESLFKRKITDQGTAEFLKAITATHPYFSPAQFFLLRLTGEEEQGYKDQAARTAVLFNNPYWLNFQLNLTGLAGNTEVMTGSMKEVEPLEELLIPKQQPLTVQENANHENTKGEPQNIVEAGNKEQLFEPMHISDYFASQGIKLSEEQPGTDKLGKQLRSFTEWLKTMKRLHHANPVSDLAREPGAVLAEQAVQVLAEKSNQEDFVVTEAMAEVLAKQGLTEKALSVYQKLSLSDPAKSAYFAAKIEQLKGS